MSVTYFYISINGFLQHVLSYPSIYATFTPTYEKHMKCPKGLCGACSKSYQETLSVLT